MADRDGVEARVEIRQKRPRRVGDRKLSLVFELRDRRGGRISVSIIRTEVVEFGISAADSR
jgi:hypothetical protein